MNRFQYLLSKLAEEAAEIAQIALKTQQFGQDEVYECLSNIERVNVEFNDLLAVVELLNKEFDTLLIANRCLMDKKQDKIWYYHGHSVKQGMTQIGG